MSKGAHVKIAVIGIASVAVVGAMSAVTFFLLRPDKTAEPAIALQAPAQIARPDPLRFEPGRTEDYERRPPSG